MREDIDGLSRSTTASRSRARGRTPPNSLQASPFLRRLDRQANEGVRFLRKEQRGLPRGAPGASSSASVSLFSPGENTSPFPRIPAFLVARRRGTSREDAPPQRRSSEPEQNFAAEPANHLASDYWLRRSGDQKWHVHHTQSETSFSFDTAAIEPGTFQGANGADCGKLTERIGTSGFAVIVLIRTHAVIRITRVVSCDYFHSSSSTSSMWWKHKKQKELCLCFIDDRSRR